MDTQSFLSAILPDSGIINITRIRGTVVTPYYESSIADSIKKIEAITADGANIYYSMATYKAQGSRKRANAQFVKSFWVDLDCGEKTDYASIEDGLTALDALITTSLLPKPYVVCSGYGLHVYWALTEFITPEEWQPLADKIPLLCLKYNLSLKDSGPSRDLVRILRVPGTKNYKNVADPKDVYLIQEGEPCSFDDFKAAFISAYGEADESEFAPGSKLTSLMEFNSNTDVFNNSIETSFKQILVSDCCNQITSAIAERATLEEPRWRAVLSIAQCCTDREKAVKAVSITHPDYNLATALKKAAATSGPYKCDTFKKEFPAGCAGCTMNITSPILLGREIKEAISNEIFAKQVVFEGAVPVEQEVTYEVTPYPFPFVRGIKGGIYVQPLPAADGSRGIPVCVYENDIYAVGRYHDAVEGESILGRLHLPHDGVREFIIPLKTVLTAEKLRDALAAQGVAASKRNMDQIMSMLTMQVRYLQTQSKAKMSRRQFGWHDNNTCFVVGDREIHKDSIAYSPPSAATTNLIHKFDPRGTLEGWLNIVNTLNNPGFELQAFTFLAGLSAPIFNFTGQKGVVINLVSEESGTGKTTTLNLVNSIWGHPVDLLLLPADTINSRMFYVGVHCNIAVCMDEATNMLAEALSDFLYGMSNGRGKHRMEAGLNQERANNTTWSTICLLSSNATLRDVLSITKARSEGENMRLIEFYVRKSGNYTKAEADALYAPLYTNYGTAGPVFIQYILNNYALCLDIINDERIRFDREFNTVSRERMWAATFASAFAAGRIANLCGLFNWDLDTIREQMMLIMEEQRNNVTEVVEDTQSTLGNFLSENISGILHVRGVGANAAVVGLENAVEKARYKLIARYEEDTKTLFISQMALRDYCTRRQISFPMLLNNLKQEPWFKGVENRRLGTGTGLTLPPLRVIHLSGEFNFTKK
jgi:hypothetical protein